MALTIARGMSLRSHLVAIDKEDLEFISNSLRMLPTWDSAWWDEFIELTGQSRNYLAEKLGMLTRAWPDDAGQIAYRVPYVLIFFDNPALYEHFDGVTANWDTRIPGRIGQRWSQQLCAAAWRVLVAAEPRNPYSHKFQVPDRS